jgi:hypothetical protein
MSIMRAYFLRNVLAVVGCSYLCLAFTALVSEPFYNWFVFGRGFAVYGSGIYEFSASSFLMVVPYGFSYLVTGALLGIILKAEKPLYWALAVCIAIDVANSFSYILFVNLVARRQMYDNYVYTLQNAIAIFVAPFFILISACWLSHYIHSKIRKDT